MPHQNQVGQQAGHAAVTVIKGVNGHKLVMKGCGYDQRVQLIFFGLGAVPGHQISHFGRGFFGSGVEMGFAGTGFDVVGHGFVLADGNLAFGRAAIRGDGIDLVRLNQQNFVNVSNIGFGQNILTADKGFQVVDGPIVTLNIQVIFERFALCGDPM